jgi:hypothetical protein
MKSTIRPLVFAVSLLFASQISFAQQNQLKPIESLGIPGFEMPYSDFTEVSSIREILGKLFPGKDYSAWEVAKCNLEVTINGERKTVSLVGGKMNEESKSMIAQLEKNLPNDLYIRTLAIYSPSLTQKEVHEQCVIRLTKAE